MRLRRAPNYNERHGNFRATSRGAWATRDGWFVLFRPYTRARRHGLANHWGIAACPDERGQGERVKWLKHTGLWFAQFPTRRAAAEALEHALQQSPLQLAEEEERWW